MSKILLIQTQRIADITTGTELEALMDTYNYVKTGDGRWASKETGEIALHINDDFSQVEVLGDPQNVMRDVNWILMRGGWEGCKVICDDMDVFDMVLRYLSNLSVTEEPENSAPTPLPALAASGDNATMKNSDKAGSAGSPQLVPQPTARPVATTNEETTVPPKSQDDAAAVVQEQLAEVLAELQVKTEALASAEERISTLEDRLRMAEQRKPVATFDGEAGNATLATKLLQAIEGHLASTVKTDSLLSTPLAQELQKMGIRINVSVSLVQ